MSTTGQNRKLTRGVDELQPVEREQRTKENQTDADDELRRQVESRIS